MARYRLSYRAIQDLTDIWEYTYDTWSEKQADHYYQLLLNFCKELAKNPSWGKTYPSIANGLLGYPAGEHIIFYVIIRNEEIEVIRILHGKMDLTRRLR